MIQGIQFMFLAPTGAQEMLVSAPGLVEASSFHHLYNRSLKYLVLFLKLFLFCRIILKETGLNKVVPVSHMNEHGSHTIKILDIKNIFQK